MGLSPLFILFHIGICILRVKGYNAFCSDTIIGRTVENVRSQARLAQKLHFMRIGMRHPAAVEIAHTEEDQAQQALHIPVV